MEDNLKIKNLLLLAKCSDGKVRQVLLTEDMQNNLLIIIADVEGSVKIIDKEIEGIDFESPVNLNY